MGLAVAIVTGVTFGFDARALVYLVLMTAIGLLAIGVAGRSDKRAVGPVHCVQCDGVISLHAPYCKHCGADQPGSGAPSLRSDDLKDLGGAEEGGGAEPGSDEVTSH